MNLVLLRNAVRLNKKRKLRKGWRRVVQTLAAAVVFCTTYVLILPAITMQETPVCGYEAYVHLDECYGQPQAELTGCGLATEATVVHLHGDLCWNADGELICALEEKLSIIMTTVAIHRRRFWPASRLMNTADLYPAGTYPYRRMLSSGRGRALCD